MDLWRRIERTAVSVVRAPIVAAESLGQDLLDQLPRHFVESPRLPPYRTLPEGALAAAKARSVGLEAPQPRIVTPSGKPSEPVSLYVTGTRAELAKALERQGWVPASPLTAVSAIQTALSILDRVTGLNRLIPYDDTHSPVSDMYLYGRKPDLVLEKNDHYNLGRDHMRIWDTGRKGAGGRPIWAIAATRDVALGIDFPRKNGWHATDPNIDLERNQIMADLLGSGQTRSWSVAKGQLLPGEPPPSDHYQTDGNVFEVVLEARSGK